MHNPFLKDFLGGESRIFAADLADPSEAVKTKMFWRLQEARRATNRVNHMEIMADVEKHSHDSHARDFWYGFANTFPDAVDSDGTIQNSQTEELTAYLAGYVFHHAMETPAGHDPAEIQTIMLSLMASALSRGNEDAGIRLKQKLSYFMVQKVYESFWWLEEKKFVPAAIIAPVVDTAAHIYGNLN